METKIIDIHPHIVSGDIERYPISPLGGKRSDWSKERPADFDALIAEMNYAGVAKAAIVHSSTTYGFDNSYLADSVALEPKRFAGVFSVDMLADDASEKIKYWVRERGMGGLRMFMAGSTQKQSTALDDPKVFSGLKCCEELGISVTIQIHREGLPQFMNLIKLFPNINFVLDHMAYPPLEEGAPYTNSSYLWDLAKHENVYLKLTSRITKAVTSGKGSPETFFPLLIKEFGANRIAWGSNYPSSEGNMLDILNEAKSVLSVLSQEEQDWIFCRTAQKLYPQLAD